MRSSPRNVVRLLIVSLFLTGCASGIPKSMQLSGAGKFDSLIEHVDATYASYDQVPMLDKNLVCFAYYEVRNYDRFRTCSEYIINHPDPSYENYPGASETYMNPSEARGVMLSYQARMHLDFGQYENALKAADKSLELVEETANRMRLVFFRLPVLEVKALALAYTGQEAGAREIAEEIAGMKTVVPMARKELSRNRQRALGKIYFALKDYSEARKELEAEDLDPLAGLFKGMTLVYTDIEGGIDELSQANVLPKAFMLTKTYLETGDIDKARTGYDTLLAEPRIDNFGNIYWSLLADRARIHWQDGEKDQAIAKLEKAVDVIEKQRSTIQMEANKIGFVGDKQKAYALLVDYLVRSNRVPEAFVYAEKAKARALIDILAEKSSFASKTARTSVDLAELTRLETRLAMETNDARRADQVAKTRAILIEKREKLATESPELASLVSAGEVDLTDIQRRIGKNEILLEYYGDQSNLFAFVVTGSAVEAVSLQTADLGNTVKQLRKEILEPGSESYRQTSRALHNQLIKPVSHLLNNVNLTVVPHGALHYVPFGALFDGRQYLIEQYSIRVLPSASVMAYLNKDRTSGSDLPILAMGNPDLGDSRYDLPGAEREVIKIGNDIREAKVLTRKSASETVLKSYGPRAGILHVASHGEFNPEAPLKSRLLLSPDSQNDGNLTVEELYDLQIASDLVTLSACQTGLGDIQSGDDVIGLTRGFLFAGAASIVASLWVVDDEATAILMTNLYGMLQRTSKRDALRSAQLKVKQNYNPHPFYWAAFQITGAAD